MKTALRLPAVLLLFCAAALAAGVSHYDMGPVHYFTPEPADEANLIGFANGFTIDTRTGWSDIPAALRLDAPATGPAWHLVQFQGPVRQEWLRGLRELGVRPVGYFPSYAVLARLDPDQVRQVKALPEVGWVGLFQPAFKLEQSLLGRAGPLDIVVQMMPGEEPEPVLAVIASAGGTAGEVAVTSYATTFRAAIGASSLPELARLQQVLWMQEWTEPTVCNSNVQWVMQNGWMAGAPPDTSLANRKAWLNGVRGQRVVLSTTDTGLNTGHDMFRDPDQGVTPPGIWPDHRKVVAFKLYQGASANEAPYHGSHVNGTVAGDDSVTGGTSYYDGVSIKARLYFVDIFNASGGAVISSDLTPLWDSVHLGRGLPDSIRPIMQQSGSWRWYNSSGTYLLPDASTDNYCWQHKDFLNIMAAGNEGPTRRTIGNPSLAKDVLTIGATGNGTSSNFIASFSSRGPSQDGRIKPNVMAPGYLLYSARPAPETNTYQSASGTSMATPSTNGAVGLMRCYLREGFYPTGAPVPGNRIDYISSALLRSMAMASADPNVSSYTVPDTNIGWGRVDVDSVLYFTGDLRKLIIRDDTTGVATGQYREDTFHVNSSIPLRLCLAWTDTAAAVNANPTLVNNLNLELIAPGGTTYRGNQYSGGQSVANPTVWDNVNVEECCRVNSPSTGTWRVRVYGYNVPATRQPFALTVTGDVGPLVRNVGVTHIVAPTGTIDSTQTVAPACSVHNYGNITVSYSVQMAIGASYSQTVAVGSHAPGTRVEVTFPSGSNWPRGTHAVRCSTMLAADTSRQNDTLSGSVFVRVLDAAATAITAPTGGVDSGAAVVPSATVTNNGNVPATFRVWFAISDGYLDSALVSDLAAGASADPTFPAWTATRRGAWTTSCSTRLAGDLVSSNDRIRGSVTVQVGDVGTTAILAPTDTTDSGATVIPRAIVRNHGNLAVSFSVEFRVTDGYVDSVSVSNLPPDSVRNLLFSPWRPLQRGSYAAVCTTRLGGDLDPGNNALTQPAFVRVRDVALDRIVSPPDTLGSRSPVVPQVDVRNPGNTTVSFSVLLHIGAYADVQLVSDLGPGGSTPVSFALWQPDWGSFPLVCSTALAGDAVAANNRLDRTVRVGRVLPPGWMEMASIPSAPSTKAVKDGGWLSFDPEAELFYAAKGNKSGDFYRYDPATNVWSVLPTIPSGTEAKVPGKGCHGHADDGGRLFVAKGNSTAGYHRYDAGAMAWTQLADVPLYPSGKKVKGGTDMAYVVLNDTGYIYLLKGYKTDFYRFNTLTGVWDTSLPPAPAGMKPKWDKGSWLAHDGGNLIWAHKAKYQELYAFDLNTGTWGQQLPGMPLIGRAGRTKKSKDGGSGVYYDGAIYALKGGNTQEFWKCTITEAGVSWTELDTMPAFGSTGKKKRVKAGGDIAAYGGGAFFALKGNKTLEFWRYVERTPAAPGPVLRSGIQAGPLDARHVAFAVTPTVASGGFAVLSYSLPAGTAARVRAFDVAGREAICRTFVASRTGTTGLDLSPLAAGVYLLRLESDGFTASRKFVVQ